MGRVRGTDEHGATRFSMLPTQGPEVRLENEVTVEKTNLTESIREKRNPHV